jgi:hypothetical protein
METLDIRALERAVRVPGFDGAVVRHLIRPAARRLLLDGCPAGEVTELDEPRGSSAAGGGYLGGKLSVADLPVDGGTLPSGWRALLSELFSPPYEARIGDVAGVGITTASRRNARLLTYRTGGFLGPHFDNQRGKLLTQVIFINERWEKSWGGQLDCLSPDRTTVLCSVSPTIDNSVVNQCSDKAWHRVNAVLPAAKFPRRSLIIEWFGRSAN